MFNQITRIFFQVLFLVFKNEHQTNIKNNFIAIIL